MRLKKYRKAQTQRLINALDSLRKTPSRDLLPFDEGLIIVDNRFNKSTLIYKVGGLKFSADNAELISSNEFLKLVRKFIRRTIG